MRLRSTRATRSRSARVPGANSARGSPIAPRSSYATGRFGRREMDVHRGTDRRVANRSRPGRIAQAEASRVGYVNRTGPLQPCAGTPVQAAVSSGRDSAYDPGLPAADPSASFWQPAPRRAPGSPWCPRPSPTRLPRRLALSSPPPARLRESADPDGSPPGRPLIATSHVGESDPTGRKVLRPFRLSVCTETPQGRSRSPRRFREAREGAACSGRRFA